MAQDWRVFLPKTDKIFDEEQLNLVSLPPDAKTRRCIMSLCERSKDEF